MIKNLLTLYLKGEREKNPAKNNHFLHKSGDKKTLLKFMKHFFGKLPIYFLCFLNFSLSRALAASSTTYLGLPEPGLITTRGL
jgi:hypothetical protein